MPVVLHPREDLLDVVLEVFLVVFRVSVDVGAERREVSWSPAAPSHSDEGPWPCAGAFQKEGLKAMLACGSPALFLSQSCSNCARFA